MEYKEDTWYWFTDPREGDIFYPLYSNSSSDLLIDGEIIIPDDLIGCNIVEAVMPNMNE